MLRNMNEFKKVYIKCGYTNLRFGIDGLAKLVQFQFGMDAFEDGTLFLFCAVPELQPIAATDTYPFSFLSS